MNPYTGKTFLEFFPLFFHRLFLFMTGSLKPSGLASDEIQVFALALIAISASLVGTLLVLKKMSMLANSLSHTILLGIAIAYLFLFSSGGRGMTINFSILLIASLLTGLLTTVLTQGLHRIFRLQEDASIGIVFTSLFALGILIVTLFTRNSHIGLEVVMGNADALHLDDCKLALFVALSNLVMVILFFKEWKLICFDSGLATTLGFRPELFSYLLMLVASATAISAFRAVGVILFLAFLVGLPLTARLLSHNLRPMLFWASGIGIGCALVGVALSRHFLTAYQMPLSTGGLVVSLIGVSFLLALLPRHLTLSKKMG